MSHSSCAEEIFSLYVTGLSLCQVSWGKRQEDGGQGRGGGEEGRGREGGGDRERKEGREEGKDKREGERERGRGKGKRRGRKGKIKGRERERRRGIGRREGEGEGGGLGLGPGLRRERLCEQYYNSNVPSFDCRSKKAIWPTTVHVPVSSPTLCQERL